MTFGGVEASCLNFICLTTQSVTDQQTGRITKNLWNKAAGKQCFYYSPLKLQVLTQHLLQWIWAYYSSLYFGCQEGFNFWKISNKCYIRSVSSKAVAISSAPTKNWIFFLKNAVKLINSHDIVFLQSYVNLQVNLDGKLRKKNTKSMPIGFPPLFKCSHLILTHVAWNNQVFWNSSSNSGARKC